MGGKIGNTLTKIEDYLAIANSKLLQQYKGKPNFQKILTIFSDRMDEVENVMWDLYTKRWLDSSEGQQLDNLGYNLSTERQGLNDVDYRQVLYGKIGQYNSDGTIEDLISIIKLMTNAELVVITELYPAKMNIAIIGDSLNLNTDFLKSSIKGSVAGGVGIEIIVSGKTPIFAYAPEDGSPMPNLFIGYSAEDDSNNSYYVEAI